MDSPVFHNDLLADCFNRACETRDVSELGRLIDEGMFQVHEPLFTLMPLELAVIKQSPEVVGLFLEKGALPDDHLINKAVTHGDVTIVKMLLENGANARNISIETYLAAFKDGRFEIIDEVLMHGGKSVPYHLALTQTYLNETMDSKTPDSMKKLSCRLAQMIEEISENLEDDERQVQLISYLQLIIAILRNDENQLRSLLKLGNYSSYAQVLDPKGIDFDPIQLTYEFERRDLAKVFLEERIDLTRVAIEAAGWRNVELLNQCAALPGFDLRTPNQSGETVVHAACMSQDVKMIFRLAMRYGLEDFSEPDDNGYTPLFYIKEPSVFKSVLWMFPNVNMNIVNKKKKVTLLQERNHNCVFYALLLELGARPNASFGDRPHDLGCHSTNCAVVKYLQKVLLLDRMYLESIWTDVMRMSMAEFESLECPEKAEYEAELAKMKSIQITWGMASVAGKTLYDFLFMDPNQTARYSQNEVITKIYFENPEWSFRIPFPHYDFALNIRLRRGTLRRIRFESNEELIELAMGVQIPKDFVEMIFQHDI